MEKLKEILSNAKMVIATIGVIITSIIGGYQVAAEYFVTKVYAMELEQSTRAQMQDLQRLNQQNTAMILELRLFKYEDKIERNLPLSATEKREYEYLKHQLDRIQIIPTAPSN